MYSKLDKTIQENNALFIAGTGTQESVLKNLATSLPQSGKIIFTGNLKNDDLIETVSSKKILVMASSQEGFPMAIAEALSVGVPVMSTETGDIARIIKNNENGFLLPIDFDDEQYIQLIERILNDYERFSKNALASSSVFQAERVAQVLIHDIRKTLAKN
jgi:glycosyltransferase involved in cell wall biosynthesis